MKVTCPDCDGTGTVHSHNPICSTCDGSGKTTPEKAQRARELEERIRRIIPQRSWL